MGVLHVAGPEDTTFGTSKLDQLILGSVTFWKTCRACDDRRRFLLFSGTSEASTLGACFFCSYTVNDSAAVEFTLASLAAFSARYIT
jgi:hypothetical protein